MQKTHHQDIVFTMQVYFFFGIALCLVVDTSTKSVRSIYNVTTEPESPPNSVQQGRDDITDEEFKEKCKETCGFTTETLTENGVTCKLVKSSGKIQCECSGENKGKSFHYDMKWCKKTCNTDEDCDNGGECKPGDDGNYCKCNTGTEGDKCEAVSNCNGMDCGTSAECGYKAELQKGVCQCKDKELSFDPDKKICKETCNSNKDCDNGGDCKLGDDGNYCKCKNGTEGDKCEAVSNCNGMDCGNSAECGYKAELQKGVCQCKDKELSFDPDKRICKEPCITDDDCKNSAECATNDAGHKYCKCKPGTEGDDCDVIPECSKLECGTDANCAYKVDLEKAVCQCIDEKKSFDEDIKICKKPCHANEDCRNGAECAINDHGLNYCKCRTGTEGDICDNVLECSKMDCGADAKCAYNVELRKAICQCKDESLSFDTGSRSCKRPTTMEDTTTTQICDCGDYSSSCKYEDGKKVCDCYLGYGDNNGKCEHCDCGNDTFSCNFDENGEKACVCDFGYADNDGKCEICDCGNNSFSCGFADGKKVCDCHRFHGQKDGQCEVCFCGIDIQSCRYNERGNKVCDCPEGYIQINGICEKIPFPSTFIPTEITSNATRNSSVEHTWVFTTSNRNSAASSTTIRPTGADPCIANLCQNGGKCVIVDSKSKCLCKKPYLGILCETDPCDWNPCMNNGVCKIEKEEVKCYCKAPFAGKFCEAPIKLDAYVVTLVAASVFSAIVLIFVTCVLCQRCRVVGTN